MKKWLILFPTAIMLLAGLLCLVLFYTAWEPPVATVPTVTAAAPTRGPITVPTLPSAPTDPGPDTQKLRAKHIFVYDPQADAILFTHGDPHESICPASLTKLMTAFVALRHLDPAAVIHVGPEAGFIAPDSSIAAVSTGTVLTVEMALQGMLMQSGNDAAYVLAVAAGRAIACNDGLEARQALSVFMEEVNRQLRGNGILDTHFVTPDGYDAEGHHSTPADLLKITRLAMTQPLILRYAGMEEAVVTYLSGENYTWKNTNYLLRQEFAEYYYPEATGLKTGYTSSAGACVIATFCREGRTLVVGVLGCETVEQRFQDAIYVYEHFGIPQ